MSNVNRSVNFRLENDESFNNTNVKNVLTLPSTSVSSPVPPAGSIAYDPTTQKLIHSNPLEWINEGTGTVSQVNTGTGLIGGPITTTGTISVSNTSVTPGSYTSSNITVNAQGQLTSASNGGPALPTFTETVYVNKSGNDVTGNGTLTLPYLTIQAALTSITDSSSSKYYAIMVGPGIYGAFNIKPYTAVIGVGAGAGNGSVPNGVMVTSINASADTCGFDPSFATAGYAIGWITHLGFMNHQTWDQGTVTGAKPQLTFWEISWDNGASFLGPGTAGIDNVTWTNCLSYGGVLVQGWQYLWLRQCTFLGGTVQVNAGPSGALENTTLLLDNTSFGNGISATNVTIHWAAPSPHNAVGDFNNSGIIGTLTLDGTQTAFSATVEGIPLTVSRLNSAPTPTLKTSAPALGYTPGNSAKWANPQPTTVQQALDRIASLVVTHTQWRNSNTMITELTQPRNITLPFWSR